MAPAFIVDGFTEKKIVQILCSGATVRMTQLNGRDVALTAIAKAAHSLINLFKGRHYPIVIIVDRECRTLSSQQIEQELTDNLERLGVARDQIIVSVPDRMIENWMLGDAEFFRQIYDIELTQPYEGTHGKHEIRQLLKSKDVTYHETTVGVDIFTKIDPNNVAAASPSFHNFKNKMEAFCAWFRRS